MKLQKYEDLIAMDQEKKDSALAPLRANEMRQMALLAMAKIDGDLAKREGCITEMAAQYPLDFDRMINSIDEMELIKRRKAQFADIIKQMFDGEKAGK